MLHSNKIREIEEKIQKLESLREELILVRSRAMAEIIDVCEAECIDNALFAGALIHIKNLIESKDLRLNVWRSMGEDILELHACHLIQQSSPSKKKARNSGKKSIKKACPAKKSPPSNEPDTEPDNVMSLEKEEEPRPTSAAPQSKPVFAGTNNRKTVFDEENIENILACWA